MQNPLADALITKCITITKIGQELNASGSHTEADASRIERLYFEIGSLVLANIGTIAASLYMGATLHQLMSTPIPSAADLEGQMKALNDIDLSKN